MAADMSALADRVRAAQERLQAALIEGRNTEAHRAAIAAAQAALQAAQQREQQTEVERQQKQHQRTQQRATELSKQARLAATASADRFRLIDHRATA